MRPSEGAEITHAYIRSSTPHCAQGPGQRPAELVLTEHLLQEVCSLSDLPGVAESGPAGKALTRPWLPLLFHLTLQVI